MHKLHKKKKKAPAVVGVVHSVTHIVVQDALL
jgi:hypothetical protein